MTWHLAVTHGITGKPNLPTRPTAGSLLMRLLLIAANVVLFSISHALGATDFSGTWVLDLHSSSSPDPMLKRLGVSWIERKVGASLSLESTYIQTPRLLTIHIRGPAFHRTDLLRLDNQPETKTEARTGRYTIRTWWSSDGKQLLSAASFRTNDSRDAELTIVRELADGGKTLILTGTLKIAGDSGTSRIRRVWRKR
jgi:hypothetical protein